MLSRRHREQCGEILLLDRGWTSVVVFWRLVASKRISTPCTERQREGPTVVRKNLPIMLCRRHSEHGGEILLLIPGWTLWLLLDAWWGDSLTCHYAPNDDGMSSLGQGRESPHHALSASLRAWWGDSFTRPWLDISRRLLALGAE